MRLTNKMNECFKCGTTKNLTEIVRYPSSYNQPEDTDFICDKCKHL